MSGNNAFIGGGIGTDSGTVFVTDSTVSGNSSGGYGGGIYGAVSLTNSTVSGNSSRYNGGGIYGTAFLTNSTVTGNFASREGGGIRTRDSITLHNSIVAGNTANIRSPDLSLRFISRVEINNSLIGNTAGSGVTDATGTGNILNQPALLGPLADNGGPTQTHPLLAGSPAIDAGSNALAVDENGVPLTIDQRGQTRNFSGTVDIGAFEFERALLLGDINLDRNVDFLDLSPFISLLSGSNFLEEADINRDGGVDFLDIGPFISLLNTPTVASQLSAVSPPVSSLVSVAASEPASVISIASTTAVSVLSLIHI